MSKLSDIEASVAALPLRDQKKLLYRLTEKLGAPFKVPSLHDRMKDLCSIIDSGVTDLATNKKHMEGFGKWKER